MPWRVEMLGGLAVVQGDRRITRFQTQKTGALLAYLVLNSQKSHSREALAELLWPEGDPTAIRNRLNQAISSLRRQLHPPELGPGSILVTDHHTVGINIQAITSDFEDFEREIKLADKTEDPLERIRHLETAVSLYHGELLEGYYEEWVFSKRMHLADNYDQALQKLIRAHVDQGTPEAAIEFARLRLQLDPYDEAPHIILMRLYLRAGRPKSAIKQYEDLLRALQTFDDEPSEIALKYKAKAEAQADNRYQPEDDDDDLPAVAPKRPAEAAPVPVREDAPPSIPRVISSFVGREHELATIREFVEQGKGQLLTILGGGGYGKTRLAIEAGWQMLDALEGRVHFVSLMNIEDPDSVPAEIGRVVLSGQAEIEDVMQAIVQRLRGRQKTVLILDNFEQVSDDAAPIVRSLIEALPNLTCIVTTRMPLNLEGEIQLPLSTLSVPTLDPSTTLRELAENPAIALFVERAQAVKADFQLTERTAGAIVDLCRRLEGLPLALELAASWARVMTPGQMLDEVRTNVDLLASRRRDISPRHRSLRAVFDGSFAMLDDDLKGVFLRLTYFTGGWDYESAARLCPDVDVVEAIHSLEERSMIFSQPTDDAVRFSMLETLRTFGENLITPDLAAELGWHHASYFLEMAERQLDWSLWAPSISLDYSNCITALNWLSNHERDDEAMRLAVALTPYWYGKGLLAEGREWLDELLARSTIIDPLLRARAVASTSLLEWLAGDFAEAENKARSVVETFRTYDAKRDEMEAQFMLQLEAHRKGDYEEARRLLYRNLEIAEELDDLTAASRCWIALGNAAVEQDELEAAWEYYERSLEVARRISSPDRSAGALVNLANLSITLGRTEAARKWIDEARTLLTLTQQRWRGAMGLIVAGRLENALEKYDRAAEVLVDALKMAPNEKLVVWRFLLHFSVALAGLGQLEEAVRMFGYFEHYRERIGEKHHGAEMRAYDEQVAKVREKVPDNVFVEQFNIGRLMTADEMNTIVTRVSRQPIKLLEAI